MLRWLKVRLLVGRYYYNRLLCCYYAREVNYYGDRFSRKMTNLTRVIEELEELALK